MSTISSHRMPRTDRRYQRGVATLLVTLSILIILTIIILSSSSVALFEQKTATNENRQHLAEQAAEYALNLGGEYLKTNVSKISTTATGGWLNPASLHWISCAGVTDTTHPCFSESDPTRRGRLYYYTNDGAAHPAGGSAGLDLFNPVPVTLTAQANGQVATAARLSTVGGSANFPATATVSALLCRVDATTTLAPNDHCRLSPTTGRRIAVTLIATGNLPGENASAVVRETWGTVNKNSFSSSTPLVASGTVNFVGTFTVVDAPNAGGYGIPGAVWAPKDVSGSGSWQTCPMEDYLSGYPKSQLTTNPGCAATTPSSCNCDAEIITGAHSADGNDILDIDGNAGANPDISFFPGGDAAGAVGSHTYGGTRRDYRVCTAAAAPYADCVTAGACPPSHPYCLTDDNLFEWIFGVDVTGGDNTVVQQTCTVPALYDPSGTHAGDCELAALADFNFQPIADCSGLNASSSGLYYVTGSCSLPNVPQIGKPSSPVILVVDNDIRFGGTNDFFGMVFVRNEDNRATISGNSNGKFFGSIVAEGSAVNLNGTMDVVYMDTSAGNPDDPLPTTTRFARLPDSWLDNGKGF